MRKLLEFIAAITLIVLGWLTWQALYGPNRLPDRIPTHFDAAGHPNGWGSPSTMLLMPAIALGVYMLLTVVARFPGGFNYPIRPTPEILPRLRSVTQDMLVLLKAELAFLFTALQWVFIRSARTGEGHLFTQVLPVVILMTLGTVAWYIFALFRCAAAPAES